MKLEDILTLSKAGFTAQQIQKFIQPQPQPQPVQYAQPQPQPVQPQTSGGYVPTLPPAVQPDPMKDIMLENYMNAPGTNMYDVHDVVADMIGAKAPAGLQQKGGNK